MMSSTRSASAEFRLVGFATRGSLPLRNLPGMRSPFSSRREARAPPVKQNSLSALYLPLTRPHRWSGSTDRVSIDPTMPDRRDERDALLRRARDGDRRALGDLFALHRDRLRLMVHLRLDQRLQGRIDPSDVLQEAYVEALERFSD